MNHLFFFIIAKKLVIEAVSRAKEKRNKKSDNGTSFVNMFVN